MTLTMTIGVPGAGKTTWAIAQCAAEPSTVRINKDDLRFELRGIQKGQAGLCRGNAAREARKLNAYDDQGARFDADRVYRYRLWRIWGKSCIGVLWIMLNPSTADENVLDPTLRRCEGFTAEWGYDGFEVCNLFALRSTDPKGLYKVADPVGPLNDAAILMAARAAHTIIVGWGSERLAGARAEHVTALLHRHGHDLYCLGINKDGSPKHPLYLAKTLKPVPFIATGQA